MENDTNNDKGAHFQDILENAKQISDINDYLEKQIDEQNQQIKDRDSLIRLLQRHLRQDIDGLREENQQLKRELMYCREVIEALELENERIKHMLKDVD